MDRDNRYIPQVIESRNSDPITPRRRRRFELSPRQALHYNDHPDAIIEDFDRSEYGAVLREIERHDQSRRLIERGRGARSHSAICLASSPARTSCTRSNRCSPRTSRSRTVTVDDMLLSPKATPTFERVDSDVRPA
jgi:hypothetical protein